MTLSTNRTLSILIVIICGWYLVLCTKHYFNQRPLWNDEEAVLESVQEYSPNQMFSQPLMAFQVFPRCYLFLIQQFSKQFDYHLLSLRFFAFLFMLSAFGVWLKIAKYEFREPFAYLTFVLSWCASAVLIYYSAELKQYSLDVFAASLFILFVYHQQRLQEHTNKWLYPIILILLPVFGLFSYPAFIMAMIPLYNLFIYGLRDRKRFKYFSIYSVSLIIVLLTSYFIDMRYRHLSVVSEGFADYFISFKSAEEFFKTFGEGVSNLFLRWFAQLPKIVKKMCIPFMITSSATSLDVILVFKRLLVLYSSTLIL